ncbi:hypothetical protein AVEN_126298-1 [Araneus ventricosus]|uniref:Uncharacterized protein n=1 Tax=Araneus ventricosus TaxID=182803 RepID=A0A4Y2I233_ARAVE|nr:hypothetical protein AVEN_126298-1 [Araneus ventricosus]
MVKVRETFIADERATRSEGFELRLNGGYFNIMSMGQKFRDEQKWPLRGVTVEQGWPLREVLVYLRTACLFVLKCPVIFELQSERLYNPNAKSGAMARRRGRKSRN